MTFYGVTTYSDPSYIFSGVRTPTPLSGKGRVSGVSHAVAHSIVRFVSDIILITKRDSVSRIILLPV